SRPTVRDALPRGRAAAVAGTAVLALAGLTVGVVAVLDKDGGSSASARGGDGDPSRKGENDGKGEGDGKDGGARGSGGGGADRGPTGPAAVPPTAPKGYELVTDPAGFRIAIPQGYVRSYEPPRVYYYSPGRAFRIGIHPQSLDPRGAVRVMREAHAEGAQRYDGYRDGRVTETTRNGHPAARWDFTWDGAEDDGGARRTYDLSWDEGGQMYDIWISAPISQQAEGKRHFTTLVDTFRRPGAVG
ncbi:serine/threonine protein kinase, partial [Streptomyces sp. HSW2009]